MNPLETIMFIIIPLAWLSQEGNPLTKNSLQAKTGSLKIMGISVKNRKQNSNSNVFFLFINADN